VSGPVLRPFGADDDEELIGWFEDAAALRRFGGRSLRWPLDRPQLEALRADPDVQAFTLWVGEPPARVGHIEIWRKDGGIARLARVGVAPARRGEGLGRALVAAALAEAARLGCGRVELGVYADNAVARALYESFGFAPTGAPDAEGIVPMARD
jgi:ribosomal protein S18 acetylase RimI-like enzyme